MATEQRLIDGNARIEEIRKAYCTNCENYDGVRCRSCWVDDVIGFLEDAPTVDAVEVVRCKDCAYCEKHKKWHGGKYFGCRRIPSEVHEVEPDHYCSFGERRTDHV